MFCLTFISHNKLIPDSNVLFHMLGFVNIYYLMLCKGGGVGGGGLVLMTRNQDGLISSEILKSSHILCQKRRTQNKVFVYGVQ